MTCVRLVFTYPSTALFSYHVRLICLYYCSPVARLYLLVVSLGAFSHIPIHLVLITYNIAQCYAIHEMPPTFAQ